MSATLSCFTAQAGRAHRHSHDERGQPLREQRSRHRGPAYVRRAQHDDADLTGQSRCAPTAGKGRMSFMSPIAILPVNSFRPFPMKIVGCRGIPGYAALEKCAQ
jgi:hypothetical protein